jgi:uncharacterized membrane protein (DUF2068 family)
MHNETMEGHLEMIDDSEPLTRRRHGGLLAIAIFKLTKSAFFFAVGIGAFHLLHRNLGLVAAQLEHALHFEPEGRINALIMEHLTTVDNTRLREIGFFTFAYSAVALVEGWGLYCEKVWAEYLTLSLTTMFLPWEVYELVRKPDYGRLALLLINLLVLGYLAWILDRKKKDAA